MFVLWIASVALFFQAKAAGNREVWTDNKEVWMQTANSPQQLTRDRNPKRLSVLAPDGSDWLMSSITGCPMSRAKMGRVKRRTLL